VLARCASSAWLKIKVSAFDQAKGYLMVGHEAIPYPKRRKT